MVFPWWWSRLVSEMRAFETEANQQPISGRGDWRGGRIAHAPVDLSPGGTRRSPRTLRCRPAVACVSTCAISSLVVRECSWVLRGDTDTDDAEVRSFGRGGGGAGRFAVHPQRGGLIDEPELMKHPRQRLEPRPLVRRRRRGDLERGAQLAVLVPQGDVPVAAFLRRLGSRGRRRGEGRRRGRVHG